MKSFTSLFICFFNILVGSCLGSSTQDMGIFFMDAKTRIKACYSEQHRLLAIEDLIQSRKNQGESFAVCVYDVTTSGLEQDPDMQWLLARMKRLGIERTKRYRFHQTRDALVVFDSQKWPQRETPAFLQEWELIKNVWWSPFHESNEDYRPIACALDVSLKEWSPNGRLFLDGELRVYKRENPTLIDKTHRKALLGQLIKNLNLGEDAISLNKTAIATTTKELFPKSYADWYKGFEHTLTGPHIRYKPLYLAFYAEGLRRRLFNIWEWETRNRTQALNDELNKIIMSYKASGSEAKGVCGQKTASPSPPFQPPSKEASRIMMQCRQLQQKINLIEQAVSQEIVELPEFKELEALFKELDIDWAYERPQSNPSTQSYSG